MRAFILIAFTTAMAGGCRSTVSLQSSAPSEPITVDAQLLEWGGTLNDLGKDDLSIGVQNDDEDLYVSISTRDPRTIGKIMRTGLIVWVDPAGGKARTFGIRFPLGFARSEDGESDLGEGLAANRVRIERSTQEIEIIGENGQTVRRRKDSVPGMSVQVEADERVLTYELQVPLAMREGILYAVNAAPGDEIGIGLSTPDIHDANDAQLPGSGGLPGGRMSSSDGRGYRGMRSGGSFSPEPMNHWMLVTLSDAR